MKRDGGRLIAVKSDLVREQLVQQLLDAVLERLEDDPSGEAAAALSMLPQLDAEGLREEKLAHAGYWSRVVERERFEPARQPIEKLGGELRAKRDSGETNDEAVARLSWELASREPAERPDPGDRDAVTWLVPGPGGHVRHYLAVEMVRTLGPAGWEPTAQELERGKKAWVSGFLVACCLETARSR